VSADLYLWCQCHCLQIAREHADKSNQTKCCTNMPSGHNHAPKHIAMSSLSLCASAASYMQAASSCRFLSLCPWLGRHQHQAWAVHGDQHPFAVLHDVHCAQLGRHHEDVDQMKVQSSPLACCSAVQMIPTSGTCSPGDLNKHYPGDVRPAGHVDSGTKTPSSLESCEINNKSLALSVTPKTRQDA
jgi:hypothetical protein